MATALLYQLIGEENTEVHVAKIEQGYSVTVWDLDVGKPFPFAIICKTLQQAYDKACAIAEGKKG